MFGSRITEADGTKSFILISISVFIENMCLRKVTFAVTKIKTSRHFTGEYRSLCLLPVMQLDN